MNARVPLYSGPTANPAADAERWNDEQELSDELRQEAERQAPAIVLAQLLRGSPGHWFKYRICAGAMYSPDEIMADAADQDDRSRDALEKLMTSPAALEFLQCASEWFCKDRAVDIYLEHLRGLQ